MVVDLLLYFNQPALRITARLRKIARQAHVALLSVASALLALVNIELPDAASPPIPSPFGLWRSTKSISNKPELTQTQLRTDISIFIF